MKRLGVRRTVRGRLSFIDAGRRRHHGDTTSCGDDQALVVVPPGATHPRFAAVLSDPSKFPLSQRVLHNANHSTNGWESSCVEVSPSELRFYFETATDAGLHGYQRVARAVALNELPGEAVNMMGVGYALWVVDRQEYLDLISIRPALTGDDTATTNVPSPEDQ